MPDKALDQMISAFAAGSLDKENFVQFKRYVRKGGELPKGELGEQQNVVSLMPTILNLEVPEERVKGLVVKKIIQIQKDRRKEGTSETESEATEEVMHEREETSDSRRDKTEPKERKRKSLHDTKGPRMTSAGPDVDKKTKEIKAIGSIIPWVLVFIMLVALIIATFYFMKMTSELEEKVNEVKDQLAGFQSEVARTNGFIDDNQDLIEFFNYSDIKIVNLLPMSSRSNAWGRLLLSFESGEGLLQLKHMPSLAGSEVYQVWMVSKDVTLSIASITTNPDVKYYRISNIPYLPERDINLFRVTKEPGPDVTVPEGTAYLYGMFLSEEGRLR